jgi:predicted nucleic acid-binding protein
MPDVVLDTNTIGDFLSQYFNPQAADRGRKKFSEEGMLSRIMVAPINRILVNYRRHELGADIQSPYAMGLVVTSTFAFIELSRNWQTMVNGRFSIYQLEAFLIEPPEWFNLAPVDESLLPYYCEIPTDVFVRGERHAIEWCDAIHAATADSRGRDSLLATTDQRLQAIPHLQSRILGR